MSLAEAPFAAPPADTEAEPAHKVLFLGRLYAGHRTRFFNLKQHTQDDPRIEARYSGISGWVEGGLIERIAPLPTGVRGRLRALRESAPIAAWPKPDAIWTSGLEAIAPLLATQRGPLRRPLLLDLDSTVDQLESMAQHYFNRPEKQGASRALAQLIERTVWANTSRFLPWSRWAAQGLEAKGVPQEKITVLPPGVDLDSWQPRHSKADDNDGALRLLFVGGDFARKGGETLLQVLESSFGASFSLDIVTRDPVRPASPNVHLHRAEANTPALRELYANADIFVLPTQAECFGIASIEAMASGLPVIVSDVGGAADIVSEGETGWLIQPTEQALVDALRNALSMRRSLPAMGRSARAMAEERFDGRRNDARVVDLIVEEIERWHANARRRR